MQKDCMLLRFGVIIFYIQSVSHKSTSYSAMQFYKKCHLLHLIKKIFFQFRSQGVIIQIKPETNALSMLPFWDFQIDDFESLIKKNTLL